MRRKQVLLLVGLLLYIILTWWQIDVLWRSFVSCVSFAGMLVFENQSPAVHWNLSLVEHWVAAGVWVVGGLWLVRSLIFRSSVERRKTAAESTLLVFGFFALAAPIVSPVAPNVQGDPLTTRLLPPFSVGWIVSLKSEGEVPETGGRLMQSFTAASKALVHPSKRFSRERDDSHLRDADVIASRRMLFLFGTDDSARDVFSRAVYGARVSLSIGMAAALGALCIGTLIGFLAGFTHRFVDSVLMRCTDLMLAIPSLFLVVGIMAFLPASSVTLIVVLALTGWMGIARMVRGEVVRLRGEEFVLAARLLNQSSWKILFKHLLPNLKPLLVTAGTLQFSSAILAEASLSFLGLGIQPPTASWGNMLGEALSYMDSGWWLGVFPGLTLACVLIASHAVAERLTGVAA